MICAVARIGVILISALVVTLASIPTEAAESISIQDILSDPTAHHLRQVSLKGIVREVEPLDPYETPAGTRCYGAYLFRLDDDTGIIAVAVTGICGVPLVKDPDVEEGERVLVEATIQAPSHGGYALSLKGLTITTEREGTVQAIANRITPLAE